MRNTAQRKTERKPSQSHIVGALWRGGMTD